MFSNDKGVIKDVNFKIVFFIKKNINHQRLKQKQTLFLK